MTNLIGEFECKIDAKGRFMLPAGLKKQLPPEVQDRFVINRGFEKCIVLYPQNVWKVISDEVNQLNLYNKKNRDFVRYFYRGASESVLDSVNRLLLPKQLIQYAGIDKEIVFVSDISIEEAKNSLLQEWDLIFLDLRFGELDHSIINPEALTGHKMARHFRL